MSEAIETAPESDAKACRTCKMVLPIEDFCKDIAYKSGIGTECKPCHAEKGRTRWRKRTRWFRRV